MEQTPQTTSNKILFLKKTPHSIMGAEKYLKKRGWQIISTHDLKVAVLKAVEFKPDFIFIAFDHPNKKVTHLPKVFNQVLRSTIVPYAEAQSSYAIHQIRQSGSTYSLTPPIMGPKIERLIHKIRTDLENPQTAPQTAKNKASMPSIKTEKEDALIKIGGSQTQMSSNMSTTISSEGGFNLTNLLSSALSSESYEQNFDPSVGTFMSEEDLKNFLTSASTMQLSSMCPDAVKNSNESESDFHSRLTELLKQKNRTAMRQESERVFLDEVYAKAMELLDDQAAKKTSSQQPEMSQQLTRKLVEKALKETMEYCPESLQRGHGEDQNAYSKRLLTQLTDQMRLNNLDLGELATEFPSTTATASTAKQTLEMLQDNSLSQDLLPASAKTFSHCYIVDSKIFYGYVVVATANQLEINEQFNHLIENHLRKYLTDVGRTIDVNEDMDMHLQEIEWQDWSKEKAAVLEGKITSQQRITLEFIPAETSQKPVAKSQTPMFAVSIKEFMDEIPIEFSLYIHLPQNAKYVHYTRGGYIFYQAQKLRLEEKGILEMHVADEDLPELKKYRVQNYLNQIIKQHKNKRGAGNGNVAV